MALNWFHMIGVFLAFAVGCAAATLAFVLERVLYGQHAHDNLREISNRRPLPRSWPRLALRIGPSSHPHRQLGRTSGLRRHQFSNTAALY